MAKWCRRRRETWRATVSGVCGHVMAQREPRVSIASTIRTRPSLEHYVQSGGGSRFVEGARPPPEVGGRARREGRVARGARPWPAGARPRPKSSGTRFPARTRPVWRAAPRQRALRFLRRGHGRRGHDRARSAAGPARPGPGAQPEDEERVAVELLAQQVVHRRDVLHGSTIRSAGRAQVLAPRGKSERPAAANACSTSGGICPASRLAAKRASRASSRASRVHSAPDSVWTSMVTM